jgi:hypothetical protein
MQTGAICQAIIRRAWRFRRASRRGASASAANSRLRQHGDITPGDFQHERKARSSGSFTISFAPVGVDFRFGR